MILASFYLADRFHLNTSSGFTPIHTFIAWWTLAIAVVGILIFFIPAYLGIRFVTVFATTLALLSMCIGAPSGFHQLDGTSFFSGLGGHGWLTVYLAYSFLLTCNVRFFIYTLIPIDFITVLGAKALSNSSLVDPNTIFVTFAGKVFFSTADNFLIVWRSASRLRPTGSITRPWRRRYAPHRPRGEFRHRSAAIQRARPASGLPGSTRPRGRAWSCSSRSS